jgi:hypothetical protein
MCRFRFRDRHFYSNKMIKKIFTLLLLVFTLPAIYAQVDQEGTHDAHVKQEKKAKKSLSPHSSAMAMIDGAHVHIDYSAPSVRDRVIFGGLVGFDRVWQAGAHNATSVSTDKDLLIAGKTLPAGKYGFFIIPGKKDWTVIFNSRWDQHGKDEYNEAEDVMRLTVAPKELKEIQEVLTYQVEKTAAKKGEIYFAWENKGINIPFEIK